MYKLNRSMMLESDREAMATASFLVVSINTGANFYIKDSAELKRFMRGRNAPFYHVFSKEDS